MKQIVDGIKLLLRKATSRKFVMSLVVILGGFEMMFADLGLEGQQSIIAQVLGVVLTAAGLLGYLRTETKLDLESMKHGRIGGVTLEPRAIPQERVRMANKHGRIIPDDMGVSDLPEIDVASTITPDDEAASPKLSDGPSPGDRVILPPPSKEPCPECGAIVGAMHKVDCTIGYGQRNNGRYSQPE